MSSNPFNLSDEEMKHLSPEGIIKLMDIYKWRLKHNRCAKWERAEIKEEIRQLEELLKIAERGEPNGTTQA